MPYTSFTGDNISVPAAENTGYILHSDYKKPAESFDPAGNLFGLISRLASELLTHGLCPRFRLFLLRRDSFFCDDWPHAIA